MSNKPVGKDEIEEWKRHPVTAWLFQEMATKFEPNDWKKASGKFFRRVQGRQDVIDFMMETLNG